MSTRKKTAIVISGRGSNMEALIAASRSQAFGADIGLVISNRPDAAGLDHARQLGIDAIGLDHTAYKTREAFDEAMGDALQQYGIDLIACAGFMRIFSAPFAHAWAGRLINIHPSLLPSYAGLNTHARALSDGVKIHGCSVHFIVPELDAGPIIAQAAVPVCSADTEDSLARRVLAAEHQIYPMALDLVARGSVRLAGGRCEGGGAELKRQILFSPCPLDDFTAVPAQN